MSRFIYVTLMSLFIGSTLIGLAGCASDGGYYEDDDWKDRAFSRHSGSGTGGGSFIADEILSGGVVQ